MGAKRPHTELYCHLVWATWDREPLLVPRWEIRVHGAIRAKLSELGCIDTAIGGMADHVHVFCRYPPVHSISYLVQQIKGSSSHLVSHAADGMPHFKWQGGYGAFSVGRTEIEQIRGYVLTQKPCHTANDAWDDWESTWIDDEPGA